MKTYDVVIVGLGYVGLTLATSMAEVGLRVFGFERRKDVVDLTNQGKPHFSEIGLEEALTRVVRSGHLVASTTMDPDIRSENYVITVGTPLNENGKARLDMIENAAGQVAEHLDDGALVILRSTVKCGTARNIVAPILAKTGKKFHIAMCPERTLEGNAIQELRELPQIVGADTEEERARAGALFRRLTHTIVDVSSLESAEIIKLVDNTYRDVQFGFANEVARLCDAVGVNGYEVITSGKLGYKRTNVALPGLVGGPCLGKDPHILYESARERGVALEITKAGRTVNERQPFETMDFVVSELDKRGFPADAPIAMLGMAFKGLPITDDLRGAMSLKVLEALREARPQAEIRLFDPVVSLEKMREEFPGYRVCATQEEAYENAAAALITNNHPRLAKHAPAEIVTRMLPHGFIFDYWNHFSSRSPEELGEGYFAVGNRMGATA
ncbi:MAG: nucleotide sugar dehydrogenase [Rhodobacter sp.]|nr:nucleotide sugar dehydrogenase [Rhodobacter sp.]